MAKSRMPGLHVTPDAMRAAYRYHAATAPMRRWKMPDHNEIGFVVTWHNHQRGECFRCENSGKHVIRISAAYIGTTDALMRTMAHEMIHVHLDRQGVKAAHGRDFERCAEQVCRHHGYDFRLF